MIDRYTKTVLTIIAGALVALAAQNAVHLASAQDSPHGQMCGNGGCAEFTKVQINGVEHVGLVVAVPDD